MDGVTQVAGNGLDVGDKEEVADEGEDVGCGHGKIVVEVQKMSTSGCG